MKKSLLALLIASAFACAQPRNNNESQDESLNETESTEHEGVYFENIEDGSTISSPFLLKMGINGMEVEPKGAPRDGFGHHHLLVNDGYAPEGTVIVADDTHIHYGGGQVSDSVALAPGDYKLTLQFADGMHVSYGEKWSKTISVTIE